MHGNKSAKNTCLYNKKSALTFLRLQPWRWHHQENDEEQ